MLSRFNSWVDRHVKHIFVMPAVLFVILMMAFPIIFTFGVSLTDWEGSVKFLPGWAGLSNYTALLTQTRFWGAVVRTIYFTALAVSVELVLGVAIALILNRNFPGKNLVKTLFLLPMVATPVAMGMVWLLMFEPSIGFANYFLGIFHIKPLLWLASTEQALPSLALVDIWEWTPMITLITLAGLTSLPRDPYEAALVDGATPWQTTRLVTLPLLRPTIVAALTLRAIDALKTFDIIYTTTKGGPGEATETLNVYSYINGFEYFRWGRASALLMIFFALVLGITIVLNWARRPVQG